MFLRVIKHKKITGKRKKKKEGSINHISTKKRADLDISQFILYNGVP